MNDMTDMQETIEYQVFVGCQDPQGREEIVVREELADLVAQYFARREIGFSRLDAHGGHRYKDGDFVTENTLCINVIGNNDLDIVKLAKGLAMYMNQECSLIVRNALKTEYR